MCVCVCLRERAFASRVYVSTMNDGRRFGGWKLLFFCVKMQIVKPGIPKNKMDFECGRKKRRTARILEMNYYSLFCFASSGNFASRAFFNGDKNVVLVFILVEFS